MRKRNTIYADICPVCDCPNNEAFATECRYCGWPMGKDWETVEVDTDSDVILRTIIPAQDKQEPQP